MLDTSVDCRLQTLHRTRELEPVETFEHVPKNRFELDAGEMTAHAHVLAESEREMRVRMAVDAERERVVEHGLVAVRGREVQGDLVAGTDRHAPDLAVGDRGAREVADRRDP